MPRKIFYPYKMGSQSARDLSQHFGTRRVFPDRNYRPRPDDLIINWGMAVVPNWYQQGVRRMLNKPEAVNVAGNKLLAFQKMEGKVNIPRFTTDVAEATEWGDNTTVVVRNILRGHSGAGIVLVGPGENLPQDAPLYVEYIKKRDEYRIHVFQGQVIDFAQKRVREGSEGNNFQIRNHDNGWVFARENVNPPQAVLDQAVAAVNALELDFGAVDIGFNSYHGTATVYEVNTAPALVNTTLANYIRAIENCAGPIQNFDADNNNNNNRAEVNNDVLF